MVKVYNQTSETVFVHGGSSAELKNSHKELTLSHLQWVFSGSRYCVCDNFPI